MALQIGQQLNRRKPQGNEWDHLVVRGIFEGGEVVELIVSPATFGTPVCTTAESLLKAYSLDAGRDHGREIEAGLVKLAAAPWESEVGAPING